MRRAECRAILLLKGAPASSPTGPTPVGESFWQGIDLLQIGFPREASGAITRVDELAVEDDIELAGLARLDRDGLSPASLEPSLHTEGFGFVASRAAVTDQDRHVCRLVGGE